MGETDLPGDVEDAIRAHVENYSVEPEIDVYTHDGEKHLSIIFPVEDFVQELNDDLLDYEVVIDGYTAPSEGGFRLNVQEEMNYDQDLVETGTVTRRSKREYEGLKPAILDIEGEHEKGVPIEAILNAAEENGIERDEARDELENLREQGEVYEPQSDRFRTT